MYKPIQTLDHFRATLKEKNMKFPEWATQHIPELRLKFDLIPVIMTFEHNKFGDNEYLDIELHDMEPTHHLFGIQLEEKLTDSTPLAEDYDIVKRKKVLMLVSDFEKLSPKEIEDKFNNSRYSWTFHDALNDNGTNLNHSSRTK